MQTDVTRRRPLAYSRLNVNTKTSFRGRGVQVIQPTCMPQASWEIKSQSLSSWCHPSSSDMEIISKPCLWKLFNPFELWREETCRIFCCLLHSASYVTWCNTRLRTRKLVFEVGLGSSLLSRQHALATSDPHIIEWEALLRVHHKTQGPGTDPWGRVHYTLGLGPHLGPMGTQRPLSSPT